MSETAIGPTGRPFLLGSLILTLALAACGGSGGGSSNTTAAGTTPSATTAQATTAQATTAQATTAQATTAPTATEAPTTRAPSTTRATSAPTTAAGASTTEQPEVPAGGASGTMTLTSPSLDIEGDIVECLLDDPDVDFVAQGETAAVEVVSAGGGKVVVTVSGMTEWAGTGTATINLGKVRITGTGSEADPGATPEDFTLEAEIGSC